MTHADKKIEALNEITREVQKALPEVEHLSSNPEVLSVVLTRDLSGLSVQRSVQRLIETIINEIGESDES